MGGQFSFTEPAALRGRCFSVDLRSGIEEGDFGDAEHRSDGYPSGISSIDFEHRHSGIP
jgi:hypothetical protein